MNLKPEELVKALRFCGKHECITCPCDIDECSQMVYAAANQIERDQKELAALRELAVADKEGRVIVLKKENANE